MYEVPSSKSTTFSALGCFGRVFGWFSLFGVLAGVLYGGSIGLLFERDLSAMVLGFMLGGMLGGIAGAGCGFFGGLLTVYALRRPQMTRSKLTWLYIGMIITLVFLLNLISLINDGDLINWHLLESNFYFLFFPTILACMSGAWIARRMMRWRQQF